MSSVKLPASFVPPRELEAKARAFLAEHNADGIIPVPIEEIVEFNLKLNIVPIHNLYRDFRLDGWLSLDQRAIYVDQTQLEQFHTRYRFTLAHEVSHLLIHSPLYESSPFGSLEEWMTFYFGADPTIVSAYEWQAQNLAGRILVPEEVLIERGRSLLRQVPTDLRKRAAQEEILRTLSIPLADEFNVNATVVEIRLGGDRVGKHLLEA